MADIVSAAVRSRMMAGIKGKNTNPELLLRKGLHARGFRFRLHDSALPGKPDIVLPRHRAVIFAHGCFWHGHDCHLFKWPTTREDFWRAKIARNQEVDAKAEAALLKTDWRYALVWECALKGRTRLPIEEVLEQLADWIPSDLPRLEVRGI
ncbi:DNA mismatch endonuclease (patch repair protein) [Sphingomonas naasensis]|uniref:Very short patch repair endonuclease n=1 Tax=Sphingomonas naasensis TaxID=1344951 RepID=A0A4S1WIZ7_9SPHN|nr:very short patch repair endonuclease [Sphingomonas naasensis]NIJ20737.1 DNA mismatch endonuclease (patch repair protein) [Sphingomonas naasensis]TGX43151.1 DNA mismatch endonuclease Vsr [Sphingomonas naasensis]